MKFWTILQYIFVFVIGLYVIVPWMPELIRVDDGDAAFTYTWHYIFAHKDKFMPWQYIWPGPWGHVFYHAYHPETYWASLCIRVVLGIGIMALVSGFIFRTVEAWWLRIGIAIGVVALFSVSPDGTFMFLVMSPLLIFPDLRARNWRPTELLLLALVALTFTLKFSFFLVGVVLFSFLLFMELAYARRIPYGALLLAVSVFLFAGLAGWTPYQYATNIFETFLSYSDFSELEAEQGSFAEILAFVVLGSAYLAMVAIVEVARHRGWSLFVWGAHLAVLYLLYKQSFVRQDGQHVVRAYVAVLTFGTAYLFANYRLIFSQLSGFELFRRCMELGRLNARLGKTLGSLGVLFVLLSVITIHPSLYQGKIARLQAMVFEKRAPRLQNIYNMVASGRSNLDRLHSKRTEDIRRASGLPELNGTVTLLGKAMTRLVAQGYDLRPLPSVVPQIATVSLLVDRNLQFLGEVGRPDFAFLNASVNRRVLLSLLEGYVAKEMTRHYGLFRKSELQKVTLEPVKSVSVSWNDVVAIPEIGGAPVWLTIDYKPAFWSRMANLFYQPSFKLVDIRSEGVWRQQFVLSENRAREGFLLVPQPDRMPMIAMLLSTTEGQSLVARQRVDLLRFRIHEGWFWKNKMMENYFDGDLNLTFYKVGLPTRELPPDANHAQLQAILGLLRADVRRDGAREFPQIALDGVPGFELRRGSTLSVSAPRGTRGIRIIYRYPAAVEQKNMLKLTSSDTRQVLSSTVQRNPGAYAENFVEEKMWVEFSDASRLRQAVDLLLTVGEADPQSIFVTGITFEIN